MPAAPSSAPTVVSLLPSATEIVAAVGAMDRLVGRSHECDFPAGVEALPVCTRARVKLDGTSADIDARVKDALGDAASIYEVLTDVLAPLAPDVIVTQDQCEVCAVSLADVEAAVTDLTDKPATIVSLAPQSLDDVGADMVRVAKALGVADAGEDARQRFNDRIAGATDAAAKAGAKPRLACIEWTEPLMAAGNWVPEMVELAAGTDVLGKAGEHAPWITFDALIDADPDVIAFMPCGFGLQRTESEARACLTKPGWKELRAVRSGRVYATDANAYFNRPGPRLADSVEILAEILHPDACDFGHGGKAWVAVG